MIRIGLSEKQKQCDMLKYLEKNRDIKEVIVFSGDKFFMNLPAKNGIAFRQIEYSDTEMYRVFYPLLEEINSKYLLVINECMRTSNRNELKYNCIHKYLNQSPHIIVFEYFPFIDDENDFMILLDFETIKRHKGFGYDDIDISAYDIKCVRTRYDINIIDVTQTEDMAKAYETEKDKLFDRLDNKNPDTVPRQLELFVGKYKKTYLQNDKIYLARNNRFNKSNVITPKDVEPHIEYIFIDIPHRRLDLNDIIRVNQNNEITFLSTGLPIDKFYINEFIEWDRKLGEFYDKTSVYQ